MGVRHAGVFEASGNEPLEQLGLEEASQLNQQLAEMQALGRHG